MYFVLRKMDLIYKVLFCINFLLSLVETKESRENYFVELPINFNLIKLPIMKKQSFTNFARLLLFCFILALSSCENDSSSIDNQALNQESKVIAAKN
jgi:hypothetical protein